MKEWVFMWSSVPITPAFWGTPSIFKRRGNVIPHVDIFQYYDGKVISTYMPADDLGLWREFGRKYLEQEYFKRYLEIYKADIASWWKFIREVEKKDYSKVSRSELAKDFQEFTMCITDAMAYFSNTRTEFTYACEQALEKILMRHYGNGWLDQFNILTTPVALDGIQKEHIDWLNLISKKVTGESLLAHASRYPWLVAGQLSEAKVIEHLKKRQSEEKSDYETESKRMRSEKETLAKSQDELFSKLGADSAKVKYLSSFLQVQAVERMNIKSYWAGCIYLARGMWQRIAQEMQVNADDILLYIMPPEIEGFLSGKLKEDIHKVIACRKKSYVISYTKGSDVKVINPPESDRLFANLIAGKIEKHRNATEVKGQPASLGSYKGKVRLVVPGDLNMLQESIKEFRQGEVLVTSMTQPNMMVIAKRAGAIVADEGGITSHASIIARELKIPCVVGCRHAMQAFKNGDLVEVDAEKGIVKLIKKA